MAEGRSGERGGERRRRGSKSSLFQRLRSLQEGRNMQEGRSLQEEKADQRRGEGERVTSPSFYILQEVRAQRAPRLLVIYNP